MCLKMGFQTDGVLRRVVCRFMIKGFSFSITTKFCRGQTEKKKKSHQTPFRGIAKPGRPHTFSVLCMPLLHIYTRVWACMNCSPFIIPSKLMSDNYFDTVFTSLLVFSVVTLHCCYLLLFCKILNDL